MNLYEKLKEIDEQFNKCCAAVREVGTDDEWINEAINHGLVVEDRSKTEVSKSLKPWGPYIHIYTQKSITEGSHTYDKLIGTAEYLAYNNTWKITNFKK